MGLAFIRKEESENNTKRQETRMIYGGSGIVESLAGWQFNEQ